MFKNIKLKITELAYSAVNMAEQSVESTSGKEKKEQAIEYVVSMLPVNPFFKKFIVVLLSKFIDEAVEQAVKYMNNVKNT